MCKMLAVMLAAILANGAFELVDKDGAPVGWSMPTKAYRIEAGSGVNGTRCLAAVNLSKRWIAELGEKKWGELRRV